MLHGAILVALQSRRTVANRADMSQQGRNMGKRKTTRYTGVQVRESDSRRFRGKPDVCYTIDYKSVSGKRIRKDIGWASQGFTAATAAEIRARLIQADRSGQLATPDDGPTFADAYAIYERDWMQARGKRFDDAPMLRHLEKIQQLPLGKITARMIDGIMTGMAAQGLSAQTIRHVIGLVRRVMRRMAKWGYYAGPQPWDMVSLPRSDNARQRFLTPDEARALLDELRRRSRQIWLMALVSLHCGLRFGEIASLAWPDIDLEGRSILVRDPKNGICRHAVMTSEVACALASWPKNASLVFPARNGGVMASMSDTFERAVNALGLNEGIADRRQKVVFHTLRHTYASWLARSGQGQLVIADRLGHRSLAMTKRYTHLMDESRAETARAISSLFHSSSPGSRQSERD